MHDINKIRENKNLFIEGWEKRGLHVDIDNILDIDKDLRKTITDLQELQTKRNDASKLIGKAKQEADDSRVSELSKDVQNFKKRMQDLEESKLLLSSNLKDQLSSLPNIPHDDVPEGLDENSNIQIK